MTFGRVLDVEMKEATRIGVTLKTKGDVVKARLLLSNKYSLILCKLSLGIF